jgi:uncharacterized protein
VKRLALLPIAAYQRWVSPALPRRCRFEPTCSAYAATAVRRFGLVRGLVLALWRLLRCNPLSDGGLDPVPERFTLRSRAVDPSTPHRGATP